MLIAGRKSRYETLHIFVVAFDLSTLSNNGIPPSKIRFIACNIIASKTIPNNNLLDRILFIFSLIEEE